MKRTFRVFFYFALFLVIIAMSFWGGRNESRILKLLGVEKVQAQGGFSNAGEFNRLMEVYHLINRYYLEKLDNEDKQTELEYGAIRGMLRSLGDQYTRFMDPESYENMSIETKGKFGGVGIVIGIRNQQLTVISPLEGTPAFKAGLVSGDIIIKIDGTSTEDMALDDAVARIRGEPGEKVTLTIWRPGLDSDGKDYDIIRDIIELKPINKAKMIDGEIGYVKLETFSEVSRNKLRDNINKFNKEGMKGFILDLRNNPGGLLDSAVKIANLFIDEGPIVHRENRDGRLTTYYAERGQKIINCPTVVLVNEYSASASEIVSGALHDDGVATLMGHTTFGKGLVQTVYRLSDNSAVLITTDRYLTAKKRDINKKGIVPDIIVSKKQVDVHKSQKDDGREYGKVAKFPLAELKGKNGIIFNGMPLTDIRYKEVDNEKFIAVDDVAKLFNYSMQLDETTGILDIEKNPDDIKKSEEDIMIKRATEFLKEKIHGKPVGAKE